MNVYLIGYRGTGKSTVAPLVADRLSARFVGDKTWSSIDLDVALQQRAGRTIAQIFAEQGEQAFRDLEEQHLAEVGARDRLIVATGGGIVSREANREVLRKGFVVWLTAPAEVIFQRIHADAATAATRPKLTSTGGLDEIVRLLAQREPLYRQLARQILATDNATPAALADAITANVPPDICVPRAK